MAKVVRWRGQFADIDGNQYTVEIYGESTGVAAKTITLGANPLITEEDDNDDLFTPIRTQTGTLEVLDPDGTLMEEMLPADNLDHPVRVKKGNEIVWQGYMSCEAYSQDYTARQQVVEFNVMSKLEALKSMEISTTQFAGLCKIGDVLTFILSIFDTVYYPIASNVLLNTYLQDMAFYKEVSKTNNYGDTETVIAGKTYYEVLEMVCKFAGWVARESKTALFLTELCNSERTTDKAIDSFDYFGDQSDHTKTYHTAASKVTLNSNIDYQKVQMSLPSYPWMPSSGTISFRGTYMNSGSTGFTEVYLSGRYQKVTGASMFQLINNMDCLVANVDVSAHTIGTIQRMYGADIVSEVGYNWLDAAKTLARTNTATMRAGSRFVRAYHYNGDLFDTSSTRDAEPTTMLMCTMFPTVDDATYTNWPPAIYEQAFMKRVYLSSGYLKINAKAMAAGVKYGDSVSQYVFNTGMPLNQSYIYYSIRVGDKYWDSTARKWKSGQQVSVAKFTDNGDLISTVSEESDYGYVRIPVWPSDVDDGSVLSGNLEISIYPIIVQKDMNTTRGGEISMLLFSNLNVEHDGAEMNTAGSNMVSFNIANKFSDEINYDVDMSSDRMNGAAYNIIKDANGSPISEIAYRGSSTKELPEIRLIHKMSDIYRVPRKTIEIAVKSSNTVLPTTIVTEGTKKFTPVESEHDWKLGRSTLKLIETI